MPIVSCPNCDARVDLQNVAQCSAEPRILICVGCGVFDGCGKVLNPEERHWYGAACTTCVKIHDERIDDWIEGKADPELDQIFGDTMPSEAVH